VLKFRPQPVVWPAMPTALLDLRMNPRTIEFVVSTSMSAGAISKNPANHLHRMRLEFMKLLRASTTTRRSPGARRPASLEFGVLAHRDSALCAKLRSMPESGVARGRSYFCRIATR